MVRRAPRISLISANAAMAAEANSRESPCGGAAGAVLAGGALASAGAVATGGASAEVGAVPASAGAALAGAVVAGASLAVAPESEAGIVSRIRWRSMVTTPLVTSARV